MKRLLALVLAVAVGGLVVATLVQGADGPADASFGALTEPVLLVDGDTCCGTFEVLVDEPIVRHRTTAAENQFLDGAGAQVADPGGGASQAGIVAAPPFDDSTLPGFEPFNDGRIPLPDGRLIVRGRLETDADMMATWRQTMGEDSGDERTSVLKPVRLFVFDPADETFVALSPIPGVRPYTTATSEGSGPDVVLTYQVFVDEQVVVFTLGFSGAAYDLPYEAYLAPIPVRE